MSELINDKKCTFLVDGVPDTKQVEKKRQEIVSCYDSSNYLNRLKPCQVEVGEIVNIVSKNVDKFKNIDDDETDKILRKLIKKKLKKTGRYKSDSDDDSD